MPAYQVAEIQRTKEQAPTLGYKSFTFFDGVLILSQSVASGSTDSGATDAGATFSVTLVV